MQTRLGESQHAVLEDIAFFRFLTCKQFARLRHPKSKSHAQEKMRLLARQGYLRRQPLDKPRTNPTARTEHVYALDVKGAHLLRKAGIDATTEPQKEYSYLTLRHTLGVNDVLLGVFGLERDKVLTIEKIRHEKDIKESPLFVQGDGRLLAVTPDGSVRLRYQGVRYIVLVEYDRGTEQGPEIWKEKIRRMVLLYDQQLVKEFTGDVITMATAVVPRDGHAERRVATLLAWTMAELTRLGRLDVVDLFYFSGVDPWAEPEDIAANAAYWLEPHWLIPERPDLFALLEPTPP